jgi:c-di-GMP-specific phosphodiesterase
MAVRWRRDGLSRLALEADLRGAIARGEITPYYQPVVRLSTGALSGFEALARWLHPRRGMLPPDEFLPLVEEMGLMSELGEHMMRTAGAQLAAWRRSHPAAGALTVSVNLSTGEIDRPGPGQRRGRGAAGQQSAARGPQARGHRERHHARSRAGRRDPAHPARGRRGPGAGRLRHGLLVAAIPDAPAVRHAEDRPLLRPHHGHQRGSAKIVSSVVKLGQDLDLEVVAEGVENAEMAHALLALGCDYGQGFGYAPALSPQEAEVYLNEAYVDGAAPVKARG